MSAKVCVIGIDAMEPRLISEWVKDGTLPTFASLMKRGAWANVINPPRRYSGATWPNVYTGVGPHSHDQYIRTRFNEQDYSWHGYRPTEDKAPAFWLQDGWEQKQVAVINVPYAPLSRKINGMQVIDWGVHDFQDNRIQTWPEELAREILSEFGGDPVGLCDIDNRTPDQFRDFRNNLVTRINAKRDMFCKYLDTREWDLFFCALDETHCVGHACWHLLNPGNPMYDPETARIAGNPIKDVYRAIDDALAAMLERIDDDSTVIVLASHGMGPAEPDYEVLEEILRRIEGKPTVASTKGISSIKRSIGRLPIWAQRLLLPLREKYSWHVNESMRKRERQGRRFFAIENQDGTGGVRINLKGRESHGLVTPGEDYENVISLLTKELLQLVDGKSGESMVERVIRREEMDYDGYGGSLPDLIIKWVKKLPDWIESPTVGRVDPVYYCRTANHTRMSGLLAAIGPTVVPGQMSDPVHLEDLAPSIAKLIDVPIRVTDGRPIDALLAQTTLDERAVV